ncbi:MAG: hypothetical protein ACLFPN_00170 [Methanomassiliicoccales archaeon]
MRGWRGSRGSPPPEGEKEWVVKYVVMAIAMAVAFIILYTLFFDPSF